MISVGSIKSKLYIGNQKLKQVYIGSQKIYSGGVEVFYYDGDTLISVEEVDEGLDVLHPHFTIPTKSGYSFYGWAKTKSSTTREKTLAASGDIMSLYAIYLQNSTPFNYTGGMQSFNTKEGVSYLLEVYGAQGGYSGGKGGYTKGSITSQNDSILYVCVGGAGGNGSSSSTLTGGGYNGGGQANGAGSGAGGGATHIASTNRGVIANYSSYKNELLVVAGGGGGGVTYNSTYAGGTGGGTNGGSSYSGYGGYSSGATQSRGGIAYNNEGRQGSFGLGANGGGGKGAGGGGGYYGGCGQNYGAGSGGSGYIGAVTGGSTSNGQRSGNGYAVITISSIAE